MQDLALGGTGFRVEGLGLMVEVEPEAHDLSPVRSKDSLALVCGAPRQPVCDLEDMGRPYLANFAGFLENSKACSWRSRCY